MSHTAILLTITKSSAYYGILIPLEQKQNIGHGFRRDTGLVKSMSRQRKEFALATNRNYEFLRGVAIVIG